VLNKSLLLFARQKLEELLDRPQQYFRISVFEMSSRKEIRANHFQTVPARFVRPQHERRGLDGLLNDWDLAFVDLEVDDLVRF
jgi:hypothetical protein